MDENQNSDENEDLQEIQEREVVEVVDVSFDRENDNVSPEDMVLELDSEEEELDEIIMGRNLQGDF